MTVSENGGNMDTQILVAYAAKYGATVEIAEKMGSHHFLGHGYHRCLGGIELASIRRMVNV